MSRSIYAEPINEMYPESPRKDPFRKIGQALPVPPATLPEDLKEAVEKINEEFTALPSNLRHADSKLELEEILKLDSVSELRDVAHSKTLQNLIAQVFVLRRMHTLTQRYEAEIGKARGQIHDLKVGAQDQLDGQVISRVPGANVLAPSSQITTPTISKYAAQLDQLSSIQCSYNYLDHVQNKHVVAAEKMLMEFVAEIIG